VALRLVPAAASPTAAHGHASVDGGPAAQARLLTRIEALLESQPVAVEEAAALYQECVRRS